MKILLFIFLLQSLLVSETSFSQFYNEQADSIHETISIQVLDTSEYIDKTLHGFITKKQTHQQKRTDEILKNNIDKIDTFFKTDKHLGETDDTYIRIHTNYLLQSKANETSNIKIKGKIPLKQSHKSFKLYLNNLQQTADDSNSTLNNAMEYINPITYNIDSRYSVGASGIYPHVKARYNISFIAGDWLIEPIQTFIYSLKTKFSEETSLYFDKTLSTDSMLRVLVQRRTEQEVDGMGYGFSLSYLTVYQNKLGFDISQSFDGNTKYYNITPTSVERFRGIHNYTTSLSFKRSIWKKWIYYQVKPAVNFHRQYDYKTNYSLFVSLDFYFGKFTEY